MSKINWRSQLGWSEEQLDDLRYTGYAYIRQGKYQIALTFFEALHLLNPTNAYDIQILGALYLELKDYPKALRYFDRALQIDKDHVPTLINLSKALISIGKKEEALKLAYRLKNDPNTAVANIAKALILAHA